MPSINMIAPRRAEKRRLERDMRRLVVVIIVELVVAVGFGGWMCTSYFTTRAQIDELNVQLSKLEPIVKEIEQYDKATAKLAPRLELLNQAKESTMRWYNTLDRLTQCIPSSAWLTQISTGRSRGTGSLTVSLGGMSATQAHVGEAMLRLQTIPDLRDINLHYTQERNSGEMTAVEFEIGAGMQGDEEPKKEVKNSGSGQS